MNLGYYEININYLCERNGDGSRWEAWDRVKWIDGGKQKKTLFGIRNLQTSIN